ncbi:MAG: GntR family transcriptional regulator [Alicyclobacillaceae bacterium]|nr:GntR family transcriptional regulator [Alicyclobacillaceae bacterium]
MKWLQVNPRSAVPVYQQVVDGVKAAVAKGWLRPGDRLPSVRELSTEMAINHNTIAKAYQELERERVIEVVRGRGTFIALEPAVPNREERMAELREQMRRMLVEAHHLRVSEDELLDMFRDVARQWRLQAEQPGGRPSVEAAPNPAHAPPSVQPEPLPVPEGEPPRVAGRGARHVQMSETGGTKDGVGGSDAGVDETV